MIVFKQTLDEALASSLGKTAFIFTPNPLDQGHIELVGTWKEFIEQYKAIPRQNTVVIFYGVSSIHQKIVAFLTLSRLCEVIVVPDFNAESYPTDSSQFFDVVSDYPSNTY